MRNALAAQDCPLAPPRHASVYARTLHRACLIAGGLGALALHLKVGEGALREWLQGEAQPPEAVFLACVEVVLLHAANLGRAS